MTFSIATKLISHNSSGLAALFPQFEESHFVPPMFKSLTAALFCAESNYQIV